MKPTWNVLVVANRTALSAGLDEALRARLRDGPAKFTLVVPLGHVAGAQETADRLAAGLRAAGFDVVRAVAGDDDPLCAVLAVYSPAQFDEIIVSTLPAWKSRWLRSGLPQRIERRTGALVRHVEAREPAGGHQQDAGAADGAAPAVAGTADGAAGTRRAAGAGAQRAA